MIGVLLNGFKAIFKSPKSLLPALLAGAVIAVVFAIVLEPFFDLIIKTVYLGYMPDSGIDAMPFQLMALYAGNLAALAPAFIVSLIAMIWANFFYANFAKETKQKKPSIGGAFSRANSQFSGIIAFFVFFALIVVLFNILIWTLLTASISIPIVPIAIIILAAIGIAYAAVKIFFTIPIMAIEGEKLKQALAKSWNFTNDKFWTTLLFIIIIMVVSNIILGIGEWFAEAAIDDATGLIIMGVFWAIATAYTATTIALYYLEKS